MPSPLPSLLCLLSFPSSSPFSVSPLTAPPASSTLSPPRQLVCPLPTFRPPRIRPSPGWFEGCEDLVIQIRATPSAQGPCLSSCVSGSFVLLSPSSCGQRRPYRATLLHVHFCQFRLCHSNQGAREWRGGRVPRSKDCAFWRQEMCQQDLGILSWGNFFCS